ncbi:MAG: 30S ribosomal protein S7, partial [Bacteroidota bacterium]
MRRKQAEKRIPVPDPIYGDVTVAKFISAIMRDGKRSLAQKI